MLFTQFIHQQMHIY